LRLIRERWSIESSHWIRDTQFHEDKHRYKGKCDAARGRSRADTLNLPCRDRGDSAGPSGRA